jgi:hypothetical protein
MPGSGVDPQPSVNRFPGHVEHPRDVRYWLAIIEFEDGESTAIDTDVRGCYQMLLEAAALLSIQI